MYLLQTLGPDPLAAVPQPGGGDGVMAWIKDHQALIVIAIIAVVLVLFLLYLLNQSRTLRTLQRDAHEVNRRDRLASCKLNRRDSVRRIGCTGTTSREGHTFGRYGGDVPGHELQYARLLPGLFSKPALLVYSPLSDETGPASRTLLLRGKGIARSREYWFLQVDADDPQERARWCHALGWPEDVTPTEFTELVKSYYWKGISNDVGIIEGLDAIEDERYVAQEVTRTKFERTETVETAVDPNHNETQTSEGSAPHA